MQFQQLLDALDAGEILGRPADDADVTSPVVEDHRAVQPGGLFVARKGVSFDAHEVIEEAIARGAAAVVGERPPDAVKCVVPYAQVRNAQMATGPLAAANYDFPSRKLTIVGVTGTDGKTTTTTLIFNILQAAGIKAGMISTVSAVIGDEEMPTGLHVTTPHAPEVQMYLRRMVNAGLTHCVLETTSHGLAQGRVRGVDYDVAVLTNVTHEHLDEHGSFENYRAAKGLMFQNLSESFRKEGVQKWAIVNLDDPNAEYFLSFPADHHITYGINQYSQIHADISAKATYEPKTTQVSIRMKRMNQSQSDAPLVTATPLVGAFNVQNILAATAATYALDCPEEAILRGIKTVPPVPGRMERIDEGQDFLAIVDFAHTPNALRRALEAARTMIPADRRVIAVFGSAGLRDREKRRLMAEVSAELADISVFTAEDPRMESLDAILQVMADAAISKGGVEGQTFYRVRDRGAALAFACSLARPADILIACGKGHEQSMAFGTIEYPWDDREAMRAALHGEPLKTLPTANDGLDA
jgi:UDP-N-acetylmuramoyl-L-alanyl-D-glutamate--2,6-diaminopimelate ligase